MTQTPTKKRRKPRKRADTEAQVRDFIKRYTKLLDKWIIQSGLAASKLTSYQKKLVYYYGRLDALACLKAQSEEERARHRAAAAEVQLRRRVERDAGKQLRRIELR